MTRFSTFALAALVSCGAFTSLMPLFAADAPGVQPPEAARAMDSIRPEAIRAHMRFLADDLLEGRGTASRGYEIAAKYVATRFEALGLAPAGKDGTYFQPVPLLRVRTVDDKSSFAIVRNGQRTALKLDEDYVLSSSSLPGTDLEVTAPLVYVGFGVHAPELHYDDYAGIDVRGKIVVVLSGAPAQFPNEQRAYYSVNQFKMDEALSRGAIGGIAVFSPADTRRFPWEAMVRYRKMPSYQWVTPEGAPNRSRPQLRGAGALSPKAAQSLFAGAPHTLDEAFKAAEVGKPLSFPIPAEASLHTVSEREEASSPNVAALLRGSDPKLRDEVIVLTAHLDHLGIGEPIEGDKIYNGAYDNASGVASLLEEASAFASLPTPPRRSLLFLAVTGEEAGLQGSEYFARNPTVPRSGLVANLNVDMFLMLHPLSDVIAFGAEHSSLGPIAVAAAKELGLTISPDPFPEEVVFIRSDQFSFVHEGIPALYLNPGFSTDDPKAGGAGFQTWMQTHYHKPSDDMSQAIDFVSGVKFVKLNFLVAYRVAQEDATPRWNPGDFFGETMGKKGELGNQAGR